MYGYIYIHIGNYNEQFIFSTSISYHFYKASKKFFGKPFRQRAVPQSVVAKKKKKNITLYEMQFLSRCPRFSRNKFFFLSLPPFWEEEREGYSIMIYPLLRISPIRARADTESRLFWTRKRSVTVYKKKIGTRIDRLSVPDNTRSHIYTHIYVKYRCVYCLLLYYFSFLAFS